MTGGRLEREDLATRRRWLIVGSGGAGKSTFARKLASALDLPVIHLDREYWGPSWTATPRDEWRQRVDTLAGGETWVMDGNYGGTFQRRLEHADVVVVMDTPAWTCVYRVVKRRWFDRERVDLPDDCEDQINAEFLWWIVTYPWRSRPRIDAALRERPTVPCVRLRTDADAERLLAKLTDERTG